MRCEGGSRYSASRAQALTSIRHRPADEKHKLKGDDPKLPGYTAELSALTRGQVLELHLGRVKGTPPKKPAAGEKDKSGVKDKTAAKDKDKPIDRDLVVTMVVIMTEVPARPNGKHCPAASTISIVAPGAT